MNLMVGDPQLPHKGEESTRVRVIHLQEAKEVVVALAEARSNGLNYIIES